MRRQGRQYALGCLITVAATAAVVLLRRFVLTDSLGTDALVYLFVITVATAAWFGRRRADQQRESLRITLTSIGDAVITTDAEGCVTSLNPVAAALTGWTPEEAAGRPLEDVFRIVNEQTRQPVPPPVKRVLAEGRITGLANHTILIAKDGSERPIDDSAAPILDGAGAIRGVVLIFRDITERRQAERVRSRLAAIVESSDDAIYSKDLSGIIQSWNQGAERLFGYTAEEVIGKPVSLLISPDHPDELPSILERLKRGERIEHFETVRLRKGGQRLEISLSISPIKDAGGSVIGASSIARDITERKQLLQQLQEANRHKDEFLATLAHELRNPLAAIRNALQILKLAGVNQEMIEQARPVMERQLLQMGRLIDDLLDVSRIARNKLQLRKQQVELAQVLRHAVESSRPLIESAGHELTVTLPAEPIPVEADEARLAQVFANLLDNAAKYTERGGRISLTVQREGGDAVVRVKDTGIGIATDQLAHIFELFAQVDHSLERSRGGLGIGLTLVKRLTELHGGTVEAFSEGRDKGSEFVVRLPIAAEPPAQQQSCPTECEQQPAANPCKVLLVDDSEDASTSMRTLLRMMGHDTRIARDGLQALELAESYRPDVVLLDITLPKLSGHEVAQRIRQQPWGKAMKLVALTGWAQEEDKRRSMEAGFDYHFVKPVEPAELEELLRQLCSTPA